MSEWLQPRISLGLAMPGTSQPSAVQKRSRRFRRTLGLHFSAGGAGAETGVSLTRYHGVFAPNSQHRALVTPARRGRGSEAKASGPEDATPVASHAAMNWAQRLKRVFDIDIETCRVCGGAVKVIAAIEDPGVIKKILTHLRAKGL